MTEEDIKLIKLAIMLPMVLKAFERDKKKIEATVKTHGHIANCLIYRFKR